MKDCSNCANYINGKKKKCKTMFAPAKGFRCHMTKEEVDRCEMEIFAYNSTYKK